MKALVLEKQGEPFVLKDVPDPKAGPAEAVARVLACGAGTGSGPGSGPPLPASLSHAVATSPRDSRATIVAAPRRACLRLLSTATSSVGDLPRHPIQHRREAGAEHGHDRAT